MGESFRAHRRAISDGVAAAAADPCNEALAVFKEQAVCEANRLKRELEGTAAMLEERLAAAASIVPTNGHHTERATEQAPSMLSGHLQPSAGRLFDPFQGTSGCVAEQQAPSMLSGHLEPSAGRLLEPFQSTSGCATEQQAPSMLSSRLQPSAGRLFEPVQRTSGTEFGQRVDGLQRAGANLTGGQETLTQQEDSLIRPVGWRAEAMTEPVVAAAEPVATSLPHALAEPAASWVLRRGSGRPQPAGAASLPPPPLLGASLEAQARESPRGLDQGRWCVEGSSPPPRPRPLLGTSFASAPFAASPRPRSSSVSACGRGHGVASQLQLVHNPSDMPWRRSFGDSEIATA